MSSSGSWAPLYHRSAPLHHRSAPSYRSGQGKVSLFGSPPTCTPLRLLHRSAHGELSLFVTSLSRTRDASPSRCPFQSSLALTAELPLRSRLLDRSAHEKVCPSTLALLHTPNEHLTQLTLRACDAPPPRVYRSSDPPSVAPVAG